MKKNNLLGIMILAIIVIVFNVIAFLLPETRGGTFWCGYLFTMAALLVQPLLFYTAFGKSVSLKQTFLGLPVAKLSLGYALVQGIWGVICLFVPIIDVRIAVVASVILLAVYLIAIILAVIGRDVVQDIDDKVKVRTNFIKSLIVEIKILAAKTDNAKIKPLVEKQLRTARFSDPMSSDGLADVENRIISKFRELENTVTASDVKAATQISKELDILFLERNEKCKLLK